MKEICAVADLGGGCSPLLKFQEVQMNECIDIKTQ